jgi:hypothetical protein
MKSLLRLCGAGLLAVLAGCSAAPRLPGEDWVSVGGAASLHPHSDPRRLGWEVVSVNDAGETVVIRVTSPPENGSPVAGVEVYTTRAQDNEERVIVVDSSSTPESIAAEEAQGEPDVRSATALTNQTGTATLRDPLLATQEPVFIVIQKDGYFTEIHERR